ncbi:peptidoglycan-binding protein [Pedobacter frigiditerrae]|uniref:Peptidoglycan-binding protein n=1 Tax=Pedobacter frigiditerrae TaxID=2530452 RepID=A0A4R0N7B8_9SPHI|nr:peptidoglycan-binding protein [Pedobacter frigiditerrae]
MNQLTQLQLTSNILAIAQSQLGVHEATGNNDGIQVEKYLRYTGNKKGEPWCASFVSWVYGQAGYVQPKTAWSPGLFPLARQTLKPQPADVFGIYFAALGRIAHCGLVEKKQGNWLYTIEGNTNVVGSREGDGVYRKLRHLRTIKVYADWLNEPRKEGLR